MTVEDLIFTKEEVVLLESPKVKTVLLRFGSHTRALLFLDWDGTLAGFHVEPMRVVAYPRVVELLNAIMATGVSLVICTGRPVQELQTLLRLKRPFEIWGGHGSECLLPTGEITVGHLSYSQKAALDEIKNWIPGVEAYGARGEIKSTAVVIHWRGCYERDIVVIKKKIDDYWERLHGVIPGLKNHIARYDDGTSTELRAKGWHKGKVIEKYIEPGRPILCAGDAPTDEDAFRVLKSHSDCGLSVRVEHEEKRTDADLRVKPPGGIVTVLKAALFARYYSDARELVFPVSSRVIHPS